MSETPNKPRFTTADKIIILFTVIGFIIAFTGTNYQNIGSYFTQTFFPKADFTIDSMSTPTYLPAGLWSITTAPDYYVVTSVSLRTSTPYIGDTLQFHVSFENKGKKPVEKPRVEIYITDFVNREWGHWNDSDQNLLNGFNIEYHFPHLDQKATGAWTVFAFLYDDKNGSLVSYHENEFMAVDTPPIPWWQIPAFFVAIFTLVGISFVIIDYRKKRKAKLR